MISKFTFFKGITGGRIHNTTFPVPPERRHPRLPTSRVPSIEEYDTPELRSIFLQGWRACEHGREIHSNPYSTREELIYSLHRAWERGWLECYHNHPSRNR